VRLEIAQRESCSEFNFQKTALISFYILQKKKKAGSSSGYDKEKLRFSSGGEILPEPCRYYAGKIMESR